MVAAVRVDVDVNTMRVLLSKHNREMPFSRCTDVVFQLFGPNSRDSDSGFDETPRKQPHHASHFAWSSSTKRRLLLRAAGWSLL